MPYRYIIVISLLSLIILIDIVVICALLPEIIEVLFHV